MKPVNIIAFLLSIILTFASGCVIARGVTTYYHVDHLGSPAYTSNEFGEVKWEERYKPYGERIDKTPPAEENDIWFTGKQHDEDIGLTYMNARYYDPVVGRFMAIDRVGVREVVENNTMMFNRYAYANNNPYRYSDPDGHSPIDVVFLAADVGKLGVALYSGVGVGAALGDVGMSLIGVVSPVPGTGQALKMTKLASSIKKANASWKGSTKAAKGAGDLKYAPRVRARGVEDPKSHNFPYSFDKEILSTKPIPKKNGYNIYQKEGTMTGKVVTDSKTGVRTQQHKEGVFEIGVTKDGVIDHRFFRPND